MKILCDTREQASLKDLFPKVVGVEVIEQTLMIGDYTARHQVEGREMADPVCIERKGIGDLWTSFGTNYEREKAKWTKAHQLGLHYVLAIEGTVSDVLQGYRHWSDGEAQESRKSGLAQLRQLCTLSIKYQVQTWFFTSRREMACYLMEYFVASGRWLKRQVEENGDDLRIIPLRPIPSS